MTGAVTYEQVQWFIAEIVIVASILIGIWKVVAGRMEAIKVESKHSIEVIEQLADKVASDLSDFKLEVAQKYASQQHLKDTEERLVAAINKLEATIAAMPASIAALIKTGRAGSR
jgi:maltodextrin utilization protein YvdJ